jgi:hypothetical protein
MEYLEQVKRFFWLFDFRPHTTRCHGNIQAEEDSLNIKKDIKNGTYNRRRPIPSTPAQFIIILPLDTGDFLTQSRNCR